jgi:hypothetical protein
MTDQTLETQPTDAPVNPGIAIQHAIHFALRRDLDRLVAALGTTSVTDPAVTGYADEFLFQLHHHHTFEDDVVWPLMRERLGGSATDLLDRNLAEHDDVVAVVDTFRQEVGHLDADRTAAHDAALAMRAVVSTHLAHEETDVIPLIAQAFTADDVAGFQAASAVENPGDRFLPWLLESAPEPNASTFRATLPPPVQQLLSDVWAPAWQAKVDALA